MKRKVSDKEKRKLKIKEKRNSRPIHFTGISIDPELHFRITIGPRLADDHRRQQQFSWTMAETTNTWPKEASSIPIGLSNTASSRPAWTKHLPKQPEERRHMPWELFPNYSTVRRLDSIAFHQGFSTFKLCLTSLDERTNSAFNWDLHCTEAHVRTNPSVNLTPFRVKLDP